MLLFLVVAALLTIPNARINDRGKRLPLIGKLWIATRYLRPVEGRGRHLYVPHSVTFDSEGVAHDSIVRFRMFRLGVGGLPIASVLCPKSGLGWLTSTCSTERATRISRKRSRAHSSGTPDSAHCATGFDGMPRSNHRALAPLRSGECLAEYVSR
jgi:hypothetical protein